MSCLVLKAILGVYKAQGHSDKQKENAAETIEQACSVSNIGIFTQIFHA
jgi:hypothetical protein